MPKTRTEAQKQYDAKYNKKRDKFTTCMTVRIHTADMKNLTELAEIAGQSRTAYVLQAVQERAQHDGINVTWLRVDSIGAVGDDPYDI